MHSKQPITKLVHCFLIIYVYICKVDKTYTTMKKIVLLFAALAISASMMAQRKGDVSLTGTVLLSGGNTVVATTNADGQMTTSKATSPSNFKVGAGIGFFIADNLELGFGLYYGLEREKNANSNNENFYYDATKSLTFQPEVTYHVPVGERFYWAPSFQLGFTRNETDHQVDQETVTTYKLPFLITTGLDVLAFEFRPCRCLAFDFSFGGIYFNKTKNKTKTEVETVVTTTRDIALGFSSTFVPNVGVRYIF